MKQIKGQISISDYISDRDSVIYSVDIIGLMDDPICPNCDHEFNIMDIPRFHIKNEIDIERCPCCKVRLDWTRWHQIND